MPPINKPLVPAGDLPIAHQPMSGKEHQNRVLQMIAILQGTNGHSWRA